MCAIGKVRATAGITILTLARGQNGRKGKEEMSLERGNDELVAREVKVKDDEKRTKKKSRSMRRREQRRERECLLVCFDAGPLPFFASFLVLISLFNDFFTGAFFFTLLLLKS
jgi:hypothetical protein